MGFSDNGQSSLNNNRQLINKRPNYIERKSEERNVGLYDKVKAYDSLVEQIDKKANFDSERKENFLQAYIPIVTIFLIIVFVFCFIYH